MGRPRTIIVDEIAILRGIAAAEKREISDIKAEIAAEVRDGRGWATSRLHHELELVQELGPQYDLRAFVGRLLTPSERIRHQQAIRSMADRGLVMTFGDVKAMRVMVTREGHKAIQESKNGPDAAEARPVAAISLENK